MDKKKKIAIIGTSVLMGLLIIGICIALVLGSKEVIAVAENTYEKEYNSHCTYEHAAEISIDGVLDEECWQNKQWFSTSFLANNMEGYAGVFQLTSYIDEYGIYVASMIEDTNLIHDGQRSEFTNSNLQLKIKAFDVGDEVANGTVDRFECNIDMVGDVKSSDSNVDRAVVVNGELNSGNTESAVIELFIPWETIGVDKSKGIPEKFYCMPRIYSFRAGETTPTYVAPLYFLHNHYTDYYMFDSNGYANADREGAIVGDCVYGWAKTANWDISKEEDGIVQSLGGKLDDRIFFTDKNGENFLVETTIIPVSDLGNSTSRAGIYFQSMLGASGIYHAIMLDVRESNMVNGINGTKNIKTVRLYSLDNKESASWTAFAECTYENSKAASKEGVKLTVIKYGGEYWVFCDGNFMTKFELDYMDTEVVPGFWSYGSSVVYKNYSCKEIDDAYLTEYLNKRNLYLVDAKVASAGGEVKTSEFSVEKGGSYDINIVSNSSYVVSSVLINDKEMISNVKKNATGGTYTVSNVKSNQTIKVSYKKCEGYSVTGKVASGDKNVTATVKLEGLTNKALCYQVTATGEKGYSVIVPEGKYQLTVSGEGYRSATTTITVKKDMIKNFSLLPADFAKTVKVNNKTVTSKMSVWNLEKEGSGIVSTSYAAGGKTAPLYMNVTATDFVAETTIEYTTVFKEGVEYQPDLMGGFVFHDGTNLSYLMVNKNGIVYTDFKKVKDLISYKVLTYPVDHQTVDFAVAKKGDTVYVYMDGQQVTTMKWSDIAPKTSATAEVAIGFYVITDKVSDIQFSNWKVQKGTSVVDKYISTSHLPKDISISTLFAESVTVNGKKLFSSLSNWNLSEIAKGNIMGSYALGTKVKPLYFNAHGSTMLVEAKIEYTTKFVDGVEYQPDLMGGFCLTDGIKEGYVVANKTGVRFTGWNRNHNLINDEVLTYSANNPTPKPVKMTMAVKDGYVYVYFDDVYVWKQKINVLVPNATSSTDLAVGLYMIADKTADIKFSNISISTDATKVTNYVQEHK